MFDPIIVIAESWDLKLIYGIHMDLSKKNVAINCMHSLYLIFGSRSSERIGLFQLQKSHLSFSHILNRKL